MLHFVAAPLKMIFILLVVIALVAWALHLMQEAIQSREFSLMLAGFLVSTAAAALMAVYFLMGHYVGYMTHTTLQIAAYEQISDSSDWIALEQWWTEDWVDLKTNPSTKGESDTYSST